LIVKDMEAILNHVLDFKDAFNGGY